MTAPVQRIEPRTLKGFRDYLPDTMNVRERLIETARTTYRSYGFAPIDTPALELTEILLGKGGNETDKQLFRFQDNGGRDVALRFDLTVPLARFVSQHINVLGTPFKRYHIAPVWRGESPQAGRFREFVQCDFDTIGTLSNIADIETALVMHDLLRAIGIERFTIRVNNRKVLNGLLDMLGLQGKTAPVLRALDKLAKIGPEKVIEEMVREAETTPEQAGRVLEFAAISGTNDEILTKLGELLRDNPLGREGIDRLTELCRIVKSQGVPEERIRLDVSIARGLDYYTGTVYETTLDDLPSIGSVCSGGRYDNLTGLYTKQELPGVGASLGLDRLLAALEMLGKLEKVATPAPVFVPYFAAGRAAEYFAIARRLRTIGIGTEVYPEPVKLGRQLKYADGRKFRLAIILGEDEFQAGTFQLKDLSTASSLTFSLADLESAVASALSGQI